MDNGYNNQNSNQNMNQNGNQNVNQDQSRQSGLYGSYPYGPATSAQQTQKNPYSQTSYGQSTTGQNPYGQSTAGQNPYGQSVYGQSTSYYNSYQGTSQQVPPKKQKKERKKGGWGTFIAKTVVAALIIGLIGGGVFTGISYAGLNPLVSKNEQATKEQAENQQESDKSEISNSDMASGKVEKTSAASLEITDVSDIAKAVMPSIVAITNYGTTTYQNFFGQSSVEQTESCGSGIIVAQDDNYLYVATNNHVVSGAENLTVQFSNDTVVNATIKGTYESKDLAVVQVAISDIDSDTLSTIRVIEIGDSTQLEVGESAIAIGNALGYGQTVTTGIISALGREVTVSDSTSGISVTNNNLIQTDAAINPGNSGGALLNANGQLIGINSAKYSDTSVEGFGFAIPTEDAWPILSKLIENEKVDESQTAYLGIQGQDISASVAEANGIPSGGIYVYRVIANSPAEKYGICQGDIIIAMNGETVLSMDGLKEMLSYISAGTEVDITFYRADQSGEYQEQTVTVTLANISSYSF